MDNPRQRSTEIIMTKFRAFKRCVVPVDSVTANDDEKTKDANPSHPSTNNHHQLLQRAEPIIIDLSFTDCLARRRKAKNMCEFVMAVMTGTGCSNVGTHSSSRLGGEFSCMNMFNDALWGCVKDSNSMGLSCTLSQRTMLSSGVGDIINRSFSFR